MARLAAGIKRRADGSLEKRFTVNGKRYSVYGKTSEEVQEKEQKARESIKAGTYTKNNKVTLDQYFEEFLKQKELSIKGATLHNYKISYNMQIKPRLGSRKIQDMERREILKFQQDLIAGGLATSSSNAIMTLLKEILKRAVIDGVISKSPAEFVEGLRRTEAKATETIHRALTVEEQAAFMEEAKNEYYFEFLAMLLSTGMRAGECEALTWGDIDNKNNVIHVTKTYSRNKDGEETIGTPKSKTSVRDIPITDNVREILKSERNKLFHLIPRAENRIFNSPYNERIYTTNINQAIKSTLNRLERKGVHIDYFSAHALRDTFATRAIEQGMNPQTLKTILGHSSLSMTMDLYAHVMPNTRQDEMKNLNIVI